jgi:hypothetical protein
MINLIFITIAVVFIIDQSGFIDTLKSWLKSILTKGKFTDPNYSLKPIDCSLCMTFWTGLVYLLWSNMLTIESFMLLCLCAFSAQFINNMFNIFKDIWAKITNKL